jgi:pilus assembly protein CpaF
MYVTAQKALPAVAAVLVRLDNGVRQLLATENTIGRVNGNDFVLPSGSLSKRHTRIVFTNGEYVLVDLGSTNGTYLNGKQVHTATTLHHGDVIGIGNFKFRFELGMP